MGHILIKRLPFYLFQFQAKFETVKKQHAEEKKKVEDRKRMLEDEISAFERRKSLTDQAKAGNLTMKKKK